MESVVASLEYKGETNQLLSIFNIPTWSVRVFNYAIVQYAQKTDFSLVDKEHFWLWWRLVHNLIANTNIDSNNIFNIIKKIDEVPAEGIEDYLMEAKEEYFNIFQFKEEKLKISLSRGNRELISVFTNLEKISGLKDRFRCCYRMRKLSQRMKWSELLKISNVLWQVGMTQV